MHQGSMKINVPLSFVGDEHVIFYRFNQIVFCQSSVSVPLDSINVFTVNGFISFGDKWYQTEKLFAHLRVWWIDASAHYHFSGQTQSAHHLSSCCLCHLFSLYHMTHVEYAGIISSHENWFITCSLFIMDIL